MQVLDQLDRKILNEIQDDFPITSQPYLEIAERIGISEEETIYRVARMKKTGLIRRIGGVMDAKRLGFYSTLCAAYVPEYRVDEVATMINSLPGVTHNYLREDKLNMWFTLTADSSSQVRTILEEMEQNLGISIISMPTRKVFKIRVSFDMGDNL